MNASPTTQLRARALALVVAFAWLVIALPLLGDYGPGWDMTIGDFPFGERLVTFLETGDREFLKNHLNTPVPVRPDEHLFLDGLRFPSHMVYPLGSLACGLTSRVFTTELGWLGAIEGFHLAVVLFSGLTLALVAVFGARRSGPLVGVLAALFLATQPRWFGHAFDNTKDVPEIALYFATCVAGLAAIERGSVRMWLVVGALAGLGLAQKANIVFAAPQLLATWWLCARLGAAAPVTLGGVVLRIAAALGTAFVACAAVSPDAWHSPFAKITGRLLETGRVGGSTEFAVSVEALRNFLATTPIVILVCGVAGAFFGRAPKHVRVFLALGVLVPVCRTLGPGMLVFNGVRHFLEFAPFLALLAALGADALVARVLGAQREVVRIAAAAALVAPGLAAVVALHPHQTVYFNAFVGGLGGAQERGWRDAGDYWCTSYLQAAQWANANAEHDAQLVAPVACHVLEAIAPVVLRDDLAVIDHFAPPKSGVLYVIANSCRERHRAFLSRVIAEHPLVHSRRVQDGFVYDVHRVDLALADPTLTDAWRDEMIAFDPLGAVRHHLARDGELERELRAALTAQPPRPRAEVAAEFAPRFPPHLHAALVKVAERLGEI